MEKVKQTVEETVKYMWRSQKNRLFMGLMLVFMVIYVLVFASGFNRHHDLDVESLEVEMTGNKVQAEHAKENGLLVPSIMTKTTAYIEQEYEFGEQRELYTSIQQGDIQRYLETRPLEEADPPDTSLATMIYSLFGEDHLFMKSHRYIEEVPNLNFHIVHELTSVQQLHLFLLGAGPLILLSGLVFMVSDIHTKDLELSSQKSGIPLNWRSYLLVQSLTALLFVGAFYVLFFGLFYGLNGLLHGFGAMNLPIGFPQQTVGWFLLRTIPYLLLLLLLFTRLNTLFSLWTKQSVVTMTILLFVIFFSTIYMDASTGDLLPFDVRLLPLFYIDFGEVIRLGNTIYTRGLIVLGITFVVVEMVLWLTTKRVTRQRFTRKGVH